jgi:oligopeptide transport system permease protein
MNYEIKDFEFINASEREDIESTRQSLTYWRDAWRRLKKNKMAIAGLIGVIIIILFGVCGPWFTPYSYSDQQPDFANTPPSFSIYKIGDNTYVYLTKQYRLLLTDERGKFIERIELKESNPLEKEYVYNYQGEDIILDYSYRTDPSKKDLGIDFTLTYKGVETNKEYKSVSNKTFPLGSDNLGRDLLARLMYGARISLTVAFVAAIVNLIIGVIYGSISGLKGGIIDDVMMRIVDIINSIPLVLYVILLMVILNNRGIGTIILTLCTVYWVGMARQVRGQVLSLKEQEYVLAARTIGVSQSKIVLKHLIPNAMGPIIVAMTMMIPSAVFTESFLSFIGLGVSAPQASWGTLANDALSGIQSYPYQLFFPSLAIALTMLSFNFLGDGLRTALDPRQRRG